MIKISFIQKCYRKGNYELSTLNLKILLARALECEQKVKNGKETFPTAQLIHIGGEATVGQKACSK